MNNLPLISVIIPVYNAEKTIESCVLSILNCDYPNKEIILINDGSKDSSKGLIDVLDNRYDYVHAYHFENAGAAEARNRGIKEANGEYIAFVDSDDYVHEKYLTYLYELIKEFDSDIAVCSYSKIYVNNGVKVNYKETFKTNQPDNKEDYRVCFERKVAVERLLYQRNFISSPWAMLSKKSLWDNLSFPKGKRAEDMATIYKLFAISNKVSYGSRKYYLYVLSKNNTIFSTQNLLNPDYYDNCINMVNFIKEEIPEILPAAKSRLFSACFQILSETPNTKNNKAFIEKIYKTISEINDDIIKDKKGKPRNKAAAIISKTSIPLLHKMLRGYYIANTKMRL